VDHLDAVLDEAQCMQQHRQGDQAAADDRQQQQ